MLLFEVHGWRGIGRDRDLFYLHLRLGWFSVAVAGWLVSSRLRAIAMNVKVIADGIRHEI